MKFMTTHRHKAPKTKALAKIPEDAQRILEALVNLLRCPALNSVLSYVHFPDNKLAIEEAQAALARVPSKRVLLQVSQRDLQRIKELSRLLEQLAGTKYENP